MLAGDCISQNLASGRPAFDRCGGYDIWSDLGVAKDDRCFYPSLHAMDAIYQNYPNATILMVVRDTDSWVNSMTNWREGKLKKRLSTCPSVGFPLEEDNFAEFYDWHTEMIRNFTREHPSLTYIEVKLESNETADILEERIGIPAFCWRHCLPDKDGSCVESDTSLKDDPTLPWNF
jgi:hypothetical protein